MILLLAVFAGVAAGAARAWWSKRPYSLPPVDGLWLVAVAFVPQFLAFFFPPTRRLVTDGAAAAALVSSQTLLLAFVWFNRRQAAFWCLGLGLVCNLAVILANGGLMPIRPEAASRLVLDVPVDQWVIGARFGETKDVILPEALTRIEWLADRFVSPGWFPLRVAYSVGDVLIAVGAFWWLWQGDR